MFFIMHVHGLPFILKKEKDKIKSQTQRLRSQGWHVIRSRFCLAMLEEKICSGCSRVCDLLPVCLWRQKKCRIAFYQLLNFFLLPSWTTARAVKLPVLDTTEQWSCRKTCASYLAVRILPLTSESWRMELSSGSQKHKHPLVSSVWWQWICLCFSSAFCASLLPRCL